MYARIRESYEVHPVVTIEGPRRCGQDYAGQDPRRPTAPEVTFFDLESPTDFPKRPDPNGRSAHCAVWLSVIH